MRKISPYLSSFIQRIRHISKMIIRVEFQRYIPPHILVRTNSVASNIFKTTRFVDIDIKKKLCFLLKF